MKAKNIVKISLTFVLVIALALWIKSRWGAWFVSVPETEYTISTVPDRITLLPGTDFEDTRIITWRCDTVIKTSYLQLVQNQDTSIVNAKGEIIENTGGKDAIYNVEIEDLKADSIYSYRVVTNGKMSGWYSFRMPSSKGIKKLVYIGDVQDTINGNTKPILQSIYRNNKDMDALLFGGDLLEGPADKYWNYVYQSLDSVTQQIPLIVAPGNHEYRKSVISYLDKRWRKTFGYDYNGTSESLGNYYIESPNILFIVIDTQGFSKVYPMITQANWVKKVVKENGAGKIKIVIMHHPVYSVRKGKSNFFEKQLYAPLFKQENIDIVLAGHEHGYGRFINENNEPTPLYIVSHCSPKSYEMKESSSDRKIIKSTKIYQTFDFKGDTIIYKAFDAENGNLLDKYEIIK